jgi:hypothetical protein
MTQLKMLSTADKLAEIRRLYFSTTKQSIDRDIAKALDLLKSMASEDERERATVYMEGLAQMRSDWAPKNRGGKGGGTPRAGGQPKGGAQAKRSGPPGKGGMKPAKGKPRR